MKVGEIEVEVIRGTGSKSKKKQMKVIRDDM